MYYIENLNNKIVAADSDFLELLRVETIEELTTNITLKKINIIDSNSNKLKIIGENLEISLRKKRETIFTLFGNLELVRVKTLSDTKKDKSKDKSNMVENKEFTLLKESIKQPIDVDSILLDHNDVSINSDTEKIDTKFSFLLDDNEAEEAEARRIEEEAQRIAQAKADRLKREAEAKRLAEIEAQRVAQEAEAKRIAQAEADRLEREAEARRLAEIEAQRVAQEAEAKRVAQAEADRLERERERDRS